MPWPMTMLANYGDIEREREKERERERHSHHLAWPLGLSIEQCHGNACTLELSNAMVMLVHQD